MAAALRNFAKLQLSRGFSSGARSGVIKNAGVETKHAVIRDAKLRSLCERLEQAAEKAKEHKHELEAISAFRNLIPTNRILWFGLLGNVACMTAEQAIKASKIRKRIKDRESFLCDLCAKKQELQLPA